MTFEGDVVPCRSSTESLLTPPQSPPLQSSSLLFKCPTRLKTNFFHSGRKTSTPSCFIMDNPTSPIYHFKILVPAAAAGRIIGKGGTTIAQLQKDAGARVKMSKASEFYPGTTERVCLISGPIDGILKINDFFMENFSSTSIKILVPNSTAGMIIGKGGSYIKQIKEDSGAYVQISQKCADLSLPERCVTVVGELDCIRKACAMILTKIVEDVGSAYRDFRTSSMSTSSPTSSSTSSSSLASHLHTTGSCSIAKSLTPDHLLGCPTSLSPIICGGGATPSTTPVTQTSSSSTNLDTNSAQIIESIKLVLRVSGYGEDAVSEITSAMSTLANYGVLGIGLGLL